MTTLSLASAKAFGNGTQPATVHIAGSAKLAWDTQVPAEAWNVEGERGMGAWGGSEVGEDWGGRRGTFALAFAKAFGNGLRPVMAYSHGGHNMWRGRGMRGRALVGKT